MPVEVTERATEVRVEPGPSVIATERRSETVAVEGGGTVVVTQAVTRPVLAERELVVVAAQTATRVVEVGIVGPQGPAGPAAHTHVRNETPAGAVDGVNDTFVLAAAPVAGSEQVYKNGLLMRVGAGNDYTIAASAVTFEADQAPSVGDIVLVSYET